MMYVRAKRSAIYASLSEADEEEVKKEHIKACCKSCIWDYKKKVSQRYLIAAAASAVASAAAVTA